MDVLLSMGFDAKTASRALQLNNGNVERSLDALLNGTISELQTRDTTTTSAVSSSQVSTRCEYRTTYSYSLINISFDLLLQG